MPLLNLLTLFIFHLLHSALCTSACCSAKINLSMIQYLKIVLARFIPVAILSILISLVVPFIMPPSILRILVTTLISCIAIGLVVYLIGLTTEERRIVIEKVRKY